MEGQDLKLSIVFHPVKREASTVPDFFINYKPRKLDMMVRDIILNAKSMGKVFQKNPLAQSQQKVSNPEKQ